MRAVVAFAILLPWLVASQNPWSGMIYSTPGCSSCDQTYATVANPGSGLRLYTSFTSSSLKSFSGLFGGDLLLPGVALPGPVTNFAGLIWNSQSSRPCVVGYLASSPQLQVACASDATGQTWGAPSLVGTFLSNSPPFRVASGATGLPGLCILNGTTNTANIAWARPSDATLTSWSLSFVTGSEMPSANGLLDCGFDASGNPYVAYWGSAGVGLAQSIRFVRATDASGSTWSAPTDVYRSASAFNPSGGAIRVAIVNGNPAVFYVNTVLAVPTLLYSRALAADGSSWQANPTPLFPSAGVWVMPSFGAWASSPIIFAFTATNSRGLTFATCDVNDCTTVTNISQAVAPTRWFLRSSGSIFNANGQLGFAMQEFLGSAVISINGTWPFAAQTIPTPATSASPASPPSPAPATPATSLPPASAGSASDCATDSDCPSGETCSNGACVGSMESSDFCYFGYPDVDVQWASDICLKTTFPGFIFILFAIVFVVFFFGIWLLIGLIRTCTHQDPRCCFCCEPDYGL